MTAYVKKFTMETNGNKNQSKCEPNDIVTAQTDTGKPTYSAE